MYAIRYRQMLFCSWERLILFLEKDQIKEINKIEFKRFSWAGRKNLIMKIFQTNFKTNKSEEVNVKEWFFNKEFAIRAVYFTAL